MSLVPALVWASLLLVLVSSSVEAAHILDRSVDSSISAREPRRYKVVNDVTRLFQGRQHKKLGSGEFAEALVVRRLDARGVEGSTEYVWKRFKTDVEGMVEVQTAARETMSLVKGLNCPHTLEAIDMDPEVTLDTGKFRRKIFRNNGFVVEKMDGNADDWWFHAVNRGGITVARCGPPFMQQMLTALACLRRAGYEHTDVKLDNILYRRSPTPSTDCPSWYLADFDLLARVGGPPLKYTPPLKQLQKIYVDNAPVWSPNRFNHVLHGIEDILCLALAYKESVDTTTSEADMCGFVTDLKFHLDQDGVPVSYPSLGAFNKGVMKSQRNSAQCRVYEDIPAANVPMSIPMGTDIPGGIPMGIALP